MTLTFMYYYNRFKPNEVIQIDIDPYLNISFSVSTKGNQVVSPKTQFNAVEMVFFVTNFNGQFSWH